MKTDEHMAMAKRISVRLVKIANGLKAADRSDVLLAAGFIRGQAASIAELTQPPPLIPWHHITTTPKVWAVDESDNPPPQEKRPRK